MSDSSYKTMTGTYIPCDRCIHREFLNCYECNRCLVISWINFEDKYPSSEHKEKSQIPNTDGNDRTDIVKASQLGFEVLEK